MNDGALWIDQAFDVRALVTHPSNPRTHSEQQIAELRQSIRTWGFTSPVLVDCDGARLIAGHGRLMAADAEGIHTIPGRRRSPDHPLTEKQVLALMVADNKIPLNAGWDNNKLAEILADLDDAGFDIHWTGFTDQEFSALLARDNSLQPVAPTEPVTASDVIVEIRCDNASFAIMRETLERWRVRDNVQINIS